MFNLNRFLAVKYREEKGSGGASSSSTPDLNEMQATIDDLKQQNKAILAKNDELLSETKEAKRVRRETEETARTAAEDKAKADGDHKQLYASTLQALEKEKEINAQNRIVQDKTAIDSIAMGISAELAEGNNVNLIKFFVAQRLKATDDGIKVTDLSGNLTISSIDELTKEFKGNANFSSLLKGSQSSGGGAISGSNSGSAAKLKTRAEIEALNPTEQMKFFKSGGKPDR